MNEGFLIVNKPAGPTSHDMVDKMRRITGVKKIGHAGTLDPFARGVLILAIGRSATKRLGELAKKDKEYLADLRLGATTDTYDRTGRLIEEKTITPPPQEEIEKTLGRFSGEQKQVPPMYSAKKIRGKKLYELARQGKEIKREAVPITVHRLELEKYDFPELRIRVKCSSGTYLRTLAHDIGQTLGCGAYLEELQRTAVGKHTIDQAVYIEKINSGNWREYLYSSC